jgi:tape measure domain-containing protein
MSLKIKDLFVAIKFDVEQIKLAQLNQQLLAIERNAYHAFYSLNIIAAGVRNVGMSMTRNLTTPIVDFFKSSVEAAASLEQTQILFETILGNAKDAKGLIQDLIAFDPESSMNLQELFEVSKRLVNMQVPKDSVINILRTLGNATGGNAATMKRVILQYSQAFMKGYADLMDIKPMANAGVPIYQALAKAMGVSIEEISKTGPKSLIGSHKVTFDVLNKALSIAAGTRPNLMKKMSESFQGSIERFNTAMLQLKLAIMDPEFLSALGELVVAFTSIVKVLGKIIAHMPKWQKYLLVLFALLVALAGPLLTIIGSLFWFSIQLGFIATKFPLILGQLAKFRAVLLGTIPLFNAIILSIGRFIIAFYPWILLILFLWGLIDDFYNWLKGNDSMLGTLLGPWEQWKDSVISWIKDVADYFWAFIKVVTNPFSLENWKNLGSVLAGTGKTLGYLFGADKWGPKLGEFVGGVGTDLGMAWDMIRPPAFEPGFWSTPSNSQANQFTTDIKIIMPAGSSVSDATASAATESFERNFRRRLHQTNNGIE